MSYDVGIYVKVKGCNKYHSIAVPEYDSPTYNLRNMFVACMDWDYKQGEYYKCDFVMDKVQHGLKELTINKELYEKYNAPNGWGNIESAIKFFYSLIECIEETIQYDEIPIDCLYMRW